MSVKAVAKLVVAVLSLLAILAGCVAVRMHTPLSIPVVSLKEAPAAVRTTVLVVAQGRRVERVNCVRQLGGHLYRAYITDTPGPQLLTVDGAGRIQGNAVVVAFEELPKAVQHSARTGVAGKLQVCRKSLMDGGSTYVVDYLLGDDEPVFAVIGANGFVRAVIGYKEEDPD